MSERLTPAPDERDREPVRSVLGPAGRAVLRAARSAEHRQYAAYLRTLACEVEKLRGEYIAIAGLLR